MHEPHWALDAACSDKPPRLFDADNTNVDDRTEALRVCNGCQVAFECRAAALQPMNVSQMIRQFWKVDLNEPDDVVSVNGVIRGGVVIDY